MTTLVCWSGVDPRGPSSINVAADSRITFGDGRRWDQGRKIVVRPQHVEIVAFAGDAHFGHTVMLRLLEEPLTGIDLERLLTVETGYFGDLAHTTFLHVRRLDEGMKCTFVATSAQVLDGRWVATSHPVPTDYSKIICAFGSGGGVTTQEVSRWAEADVSGRTSRSVFSGFCDALRSGRDPHSGGAPQLASIYRGGPARELGVIWDGKPQFRGVDIPSNLDPGKIEWRNDLFERCDAATLRRLDDAQPHARPHALARA